jgi:hypothetical protein
MRPPIGITNEPKWIRHCCKIHARAKDLLNGNTNLIEASIALVPLMIWTRAESDPDLKVFRLLRDEFIGLPIGRERQYWAAHALAREDVKIRAVEDTWREAAMQAARNLQQKYAWSLEARAELRQQAREAQRIRESIDRKG